jgi:hypothetical protein
MKVTNTLFYLFLLSISALSCKNAAQTLLDEVSKDTVITATECAEIEQASASTPDLKALLDADNKADKAKIAAYIKSKFHRVVTFSSEGAAVSGAAPLPAAETGTLGILPIYSIFIENSGSMDGFVTGEKAFKNSLFSLLTDIKIKHLADNDQIHLNYINSKTIPFTASVEDFIKNLNPESFRTRGGNRSDSDIQSVFDAVLAQTPSNGVTLFVSDCLLSFKGKKVEDFLTNQKTALRGNFAQKIQQTPDFSTLILQLKSPFSGKFYRYNDAVETFKDQERPYFLWVMGRYGYVQQFMNTLNLNQALDNKIENVCFLTNAMDKNLAHRVVMTDRIGSFLPDKTDPAHVLTQAAASSREPTTGVFQFMVAVDYQTLGVGLGDAFLTDPTNYNLSTPNYTLKIRKIEAVEKQTNTLLSKYSHGLILTTNKLQSQKIKISLKKKLPTWVETISWTPDNGAAEELKKAFGLSPILRGVLEAYNADKDVLFDINVEVKQ